MAIQFTAINVAPKINIRRLPPSAVRRYGNAKSVKLGKTKLTVKKGKTVTIKASEVKKDKKISTHRKIAYESGNIAVATVNSKGKVTGKKKGTCYIYVYAQNGIYSRVKITVK